MKLKKTILLLTLLILLNMSMVFSAETIDDREKVDLTVYEETLANIKEQDITEILDLTRRINSEQTATSERLRIFEQSIIQKLDQKLDTNRFSGELEYKLAKHTNFIKINTPTILLVIIFGCLILIVIRKSLRPPKATVNIDDEEIKSINEFMEAK